MPDNEVIKRGLQALRNSIAFERQQIDKINSEISRTEYTLESLKKTRDLSLKIIAENEAILADYEKGQNKKQANFDEVKASIEKEQSNGIE